MPNGENCLASWTNKAFSMDPIPKLKVGDEVIQVVELLKWYTKIWYLLPLLLLYCGAAVSINYGICRLQINKFLKFLFTLIVSALSFIAANVLAYFILSLLG